MQTQHAAPSMPRDGPRAVVGDRWACPIQPPRRFLFGEAASPPAAGYAVHHPAPDFLLAGGAHQITTKARDPALPCCFAEMLLFANAIASWSATSRTSFSTDGASRYSTIDVLHTASFDGCVRSQTGRIQLSAQLVGVKSIMLESV